MLGRLTLPLRAGDRRRAVRRSADDFVEGHLAGVAIGQTDDDHAEMHQVGDDGEEGRFVAAMLRRARGKGPSGLANQCSAHPQSARLLPEASHRRGHAAESRRRADYDRVVVRKLARRGDRRGLIKLEMRGLGDRLGDGFGHALHLNRRARGARAFGDRVGHRLDVAVSGIIEYEHLRHSGLLEALQAARRVQRIFAISSKESRGLRGNSLFASP